MKFTEADLRKWEVAKLQGLPLPKIPPDDLLNLWQAHGFDARLLEPLRKEFSAWFKGLPGGRN